MNRSYFTCLTFVLYWFVLPFASYADGTILVITNLNSKVLLDGSLLGQAEANKPYKISTTTGEHYIQVQADVDGKVLDKGEVISIEEGKQKVVKIQLDLPSATTPAASSAVHVAELNFTLTGILAVASWENNNPNQAYPHPTYLFAFEKGDEISLDLTMSNRKGTNAITVATYPAGVVKYTNNAFTELNGLKIKVEERSIYSFTFATNHTFERNCVLKVSRKPSSPQTAHFNTNVARQKVYKPVTITETQTLYVNSGSNATWKGGKSRVLVPVTLPANTVEWVYRVSASRSQQDIDNVQENFQLFAELTKLTLKLSGAGLVAGKAAGIAIDQLAMPPGSDYCDVFLLDYNNIANFEAKNDEGWKHYLQGTRQNIKSGNVKVDCCKEGQYYLGIRNPDTYNGVIISIEVIAITVADEYVMEQK